jgi:predicted dehydrogenase
MAADDGRHGTLKLFFGRSIVVAKPLKAVIVGCGERGSMFGNLSRSHADLVKVVAVADPRQEYRTREGDKHGLAPQQRYSSFEQAFAPGAVEADVAFIACNDRNHYAATLAALERGLNILLEKPVAHGPDLSLHLALVAKQKGLQVAVQHELRYSPFFQEVRRIVQSGRLGQVYSYTHTEHVEFWHMTHSFVRGNWGNADTENPMILAKCCHDLDLMPWLLGDEVTRVSSFGRLDHFRSENKPAGAPERCTDGCPVGDTCIYNAETFYLGPKATWPASAIGSDPAPQARRQRLAEGPYGRCVFGGYNNVVDHQTVMMEFRKGTIGTLTMQGFSIGEECGRKLRLDGTLGTLRGDMGRGLIHIWRHWHGPLGTKAEPEVIDLTKLGQDGHGGGDEKLFVDVLEGFAAGDRRPLTPIADSVESHLLAFAAEESRATGKAVKMDAYRRRIRKAAKALMGTGK